MKTSKWTSHEISLAVAEHFGVRTNVIVPNVSWGLFNNHEADLVVMKLSGWADEVEIKVSGADIKRDLGKNNGRGHVRAHIIRKLWFAVPDTLAAHADIPAYAGILSCTRDPRYGIVVKAVRAPQINKRAHKLSAEQQLTLLRLGYLRMWTLKRHRQNSISNNEYASAALAKFTDLTSKFGRWGYGDSEPRPS